MRLCSMAQVLVLVVESKKLLPRVRLAFAESRIISIPRQLCLKTKRMLRPSMHQGMKPELEL